MQEKDRKRTMMTVLERSHGLPVAGLGVEPSLWDYEPHVHRTLSRASLGAQIVKTSRLILELSPARLLL